MKRGGFFYSNKILSSIEEFESVIHSLENRADKDAHSYLVMQELQHDYKECVEKFLSELEDLEHIYSYRLKKASKNINKDRLFNFSFEK